MPANSPPPISPDTTIDLAKEYLKFSAAHFTIFSATERERLHGHNFRVAARLRAPVGPDGLCFSYGDFKAKLRALCTALDEYMILPKHSPHLKIHREQDEYRVQFHTEEMRFLSADCLLLPIRNTTVEEFAAYLLQQLLADPDINRYALHEIELSVSSGPGQSGTRRWRHPDFTG
ncbi:MAG: 6-carboxytetrahydropterin synthase [Cellvibrionales bacterium]|nr:6-carboxytetrahydropterin synthase [Cellvibrionales bacterium]